MTRSKPSNRKAKTDEADHLRAQIASLRASLASFVEASEKSIAELQRKVEQLEAEDENEDASDDALARVDVNSPSTTSRTFPKEIFLEIGSYFDAGSRTLLHLASTCMDLFELLSPRLWEHLTSDEILDIRFDCCRRDNLATVGFHVKKLDLYPVELPAAEGKTPALVNAPVRALQASAASLRYLSIDLEGVSKFIDAWLAVRKLPNLEVFHLDNAPDQLPRWFADVIPNVRELRVYQVLRVEQFDVDVWDSVSKLEKLEDLSLKIGEDHLGLRDLPTLLSKITTYQITCYDSFLFLANAPEFQPRVIINKWLDWPDFELFQNNLAARMWRAMVTMDGLEYFETLYFQADLLRVFGFPKNLTCLKLDYFYLLESQTAEGREQVRAQIPPSLTDFEINVFLPRCPEKDTAEEKELRDELYFWNSLTDPKHRMKLRAEPETDEEDYWVTDLEEELWMQKDGWC